MFFCCFCGLSVVAFCFSICLFFHCELIAARYFSISQPAGPGRPAGQEPRSSWPPAGRPRSTVQPAGRPAGQDPRSSQPAEDTKTTAGDMRKETPKTQSLTISLVSLNQPQYIPGILQIYANLRNQTPCGFVLSNAKHAHLTAPPAPDGSGAAPTALARGLCGESWMRRCWFQRTTDNEFVSVREPQSTQCECVCLP